MASGCFTVPTTTVPPAGAGSARSTSGCSWAAGSTASASRRWPPGLPLMSRSARRPRQLHTAMDGVYVHVGREWKEAKVGEVYQRGAAGGVARITYCATLADSKAFGRRLRTVAHAE